MFRMPYSVTIILGLLSALPAFSAPLAPAKGEKVTYRRVYSSDELKNLPLQLVKKTSFTLENKKGALVATWKATLREIRDDTTVEAFAFGKCRSRSAKRIECTFKHENGTVDDENSTIEITQLKRGLNILIPVSQGVRFDKQDGDHAVTAVHLLGTDKDNQFTLRR